MRNESKPDKTLSLTATAWSGILELALVYGWNPLGAALPGSFHEEISIESYYPVAYWDHSDGGNHRPPRLVLLEDALNLADALEQAFLEYEPVRVPASYYVFEPEDQELRMRPSIGAISAVIDFCRLGSFWVEQYQRSRYVFQAV